MRHARWTALLLSTSAAAQGEPAFLSGLPDVPRMPELTEQADSRVMFDTPEGAIMEAHLTGSPSGREVRAFYRSALPTLGWRRLAPGQYRRDDQCLDLIVERRKNRTQVEISVHPCAE